VAGLVTGGGTCTSIAMRVSGWEIMKMISSTSMMSIIGMTLGSALICRPDSTSSCHDALLASYGCVEAALAARLDLGNGRHHPHPRLARDLDRLLDLAVLQILVGPEVQDLSSGRARKWS
jgi:hypothetical protein